MKIISFVVGLLLLSALPALAQVSPGGCAEVVGQGMFCTSLFTFKAGIELPASTVAQLPPCNTAGQGQMRTVTDATTPAYNATLVGGGAVVTLAHCNGTAWTAH